MSKGQKLQCVVPRWQSSGLKMKPLHRRHKLPLDWQVLLCRELQPISVFEISDPNCPVCVCFTIWSISGGSFDEYYASP